MDTERRVLMSAGQDTAAVPRYYVRDRYEGFRRFSVLDGNGRSMDFAPYLVDMFKTRSAAEYAASLLNRGVATVNPHATIGCRIEVQS